jgi:hypothetical protein
VWHFLGVQSRPIIAFASGQLLELQSVSDTLLKRRGTGYRRLQPQVLESKEEAEQHPPFLLLVGTRIRCECL